MLELGRGRDSRPLEHDGDLPMKSSTDQIRIKCPSLTCQKILAVPSSSRGKNVRCKNCGATIRVPQKAAAPVPPPVADGKKGEAAPAAAQQKAA